MLDTILELAIFMGAEIVCVSIIAVTLYGIHCIGKKFYFRMKGYKK